MKYGLKDITIEAIVSVFAKYPQIENAILHGSRARGNFRNRSDIDLTLQGINLESRLLTQIENEVDDLLLPYKIDLSIFHKIENREFINQIQKHGIRFYENENTKDI